MKRLLSIAFTSSLILLTSCGGGSGSTNVAEGGMGGTGISQGPVTGFGSIYVNGVKYETNDAIFERDGSQLFAQSDFSLGEYVTVEGQVNADGVTGIASKVSYSTLLEGPITAVDTTAGKFSVLGQTISLDALTVRIGFSLLADLQTGNIVEVSGIQTAGGQITATAISLKSTVFVSGETELEFSGVISSVDTANLLFVINGITVDYSASGFPGDSPAASMSVEVKSTETLNSNTVLASSIELESSGSYTNDTELEIQGSITSFSSQSSFTVNGIPVTTDASTEFEDGFASLLGQGVRVEVDGRFSDGVLAAEEVSVLETSASIEIESTITSINSGNQTFVLAGKTIVVDSSTMLIDEDSDQNFGFANLQTGETVEVNGNELADGSIRATKVEREDEGGEESELEWEGIVGSVDSDAHTFTLLGNTITTDGTTQYEADGNLDRDAFFALLEPNTTRVKVKGNMTGDTILMAEKIELDD